MEEEKKVLLEEEINKITDLRKKYTDLTEIVGNVEMQIMSLEIQKEKIKDDLKNIQHQEAVLAKELEEKYGKGSISLESREFLPIK
jgi:predicted nuclease with TOPRIM domain